MKRFLKVDSPLAIYLPRKTTADRRVALNLNIYRNMDYRMNNSVKKQYKEEITAQLEGVVLETPVEVTYQVFKKTKRRLDKGNVVSVIQKYLLDALTECGVIPDDNDDFIKTETTLPTMLDRENPRVEVIFRSIGDKDAN
jgi:Holliday junction resolvase RusA-like endonuclease